MDAAIRPAWWPGRALRQHPIREVFACGQQLNPPLYSQVVNFPRLEVPLRGVYENQIEEGNQIVRVQVAPGRALFAAPNCWNLPEWRPGLQLLCLFFGRTQLGISLVSCSRQRRLSTQKITVPRPLNGPVPHLLSALVEMQTDGRRSPATADVSRALILSVEELLQQPAVQPASRALALLNEIHVYLQSHYQYDISRDSVARQFNISPNHLSRLFQTHGQMTFSSYLTYVRIDRAKHLLRKYNLKLDDVAARCGFHSAPYFCNVFKHHTKFTPMDYRLNALRSSERK